MTVGIDIGIGALSAFLQVFFDRLASKPVLDFIRGLDLEKELKKLHKTFRNVNNFLADAEEKQYQDGSVKMWLDQLRDAVYDAEDLIDEFETECRKGSRNFSSDFESRIKEISDKFDELAKERFELGLDKFAGGSSRSSETRVTTSLVNESRIYGRNDDKEEIVNLLKDKPQRRIDNVFFVVAIVGMGGVGKTTLAQYVFSDKWVEKHFDVRVWVCVSDQFDVKRITKTILESVIQGTYGSMDVNDYNEFNFDRMTKAIVELVTLGTLDSIDLNQIQLKLKKELKGKKFLIVLDDVWNKKYGDWDLLQKPFGVGAAGSRIVVTTRDEEVASMMGAISIHHLENLSEADCWSVFKEHAFGITGIDSEPAEMREKVASKCKGLPLAAKMLGGLLHSRKKYEWENVLNSTIWDLPEENGILPVLKLSYYYLPSHLKSCFAYCSILPKDYEFGEKELVLLWMAEGFLQQPKGNMDLENFGHRCFCELLSMSFFQSSRSRKSLFVMHPLTSDLARWVAGQTCFRLEDLQDNGKQCEVFGKARHSSYIIGRHDGIKKFEAFHGIGSLRTFLPLKRVGAKEYKRYLTTDVTFDLLPKLKKLRVLSFSGYCITKLPRSILEMKHLRFLNLSHTAIKNLPEPISNLQNLQTLLLTNCLSLEKLPTDLGTLINLRHLDIANSYSLKGMPTDVGRLTGLQKLSDFVVGGDTHAGITELMNLKHLKDSMCISWLHNVTDPQEAREANLSGKKYLDALTMRWGDKFDDRQNHTVEEEVLHMLRPHENLKDLAISNYGGRIFPTWIGDPFFSNTVLVKLENCVRCTDFPPLWQLPSLKDLIIQRMNSIHTVSYGMGCSNPFPSLETLSFHDMKKWEKWSCKIDNQDEVFPRLRKLTIERCPELLGSLPQHLPSLEKLVVRRCSKLTVTISSLPRLCELETRGCKEVVHGREVDLNSLKSVVIGDVLKVICLTEGSVQELKGVNDLEIFGCDELVTLLQQEVGLLQNFTLLRRLQLVGCKNLEILRGLDYLTFLSELSIRECPQLVSFLEAGLPFFLKQLKIEGCDSLKSIARAPLFPTVKELEIVSCRSLQSLLHEDEASSSSNSMMMLDNSDSYVPILEVLIVKDCPSLTSLLSSREELPATLERLEISKCSTLESIGVRWNNNTYLRSIEIEGCKRLQSLPDGLHNLSRLSVLKISDCTSLGCFPNGGLPATNLKEFDISNCEKLQALPNCIHHLTTLQELTISNCPGIVSFPQEGFPTNLTSLVIRDLKICTPLFKWGLDRLTSLRKFEIKGGCPDIVSFPAEEERMVLPPTLISLTINEFPNLRSLSSGFLNLTSLEMLWIRNCPKLQSSRENAFPPSVLRVDIDNCPLLKTSLKRN